MRGAEKDETDSHPPLTFLSRSDPIFTCNETTDRERKPQLMTKNLKNRTTGLLVVAALSIGAMPAIASAQGSINISPTADQYDPKTITFENRTGDPADPSSGGLNDSVGSLPFTGFDVIAMLAVALAVTGLGLALQRAVSREPRELN